ncbi:MAG: hypothetical protein AAGC97_04310 [Planctomycetota bacterium]
MIRLCVLFALVLVVMRQARRADIYAVFFPPTMTPVQLDEIQLVDGRPPRDGEGAAGRLAFADDVDRGASIPNDIKVVIDAASVEQQQQWLRQWMDTGAIDQAELSAVSTEAAVAIHRSLMQRSVDGSVWRAADLPGLVSTLAMDRVIGGSPREAERANVLPLLQQPDIYRGECFVAEGKLVRVERITPSENAMGLDRYWNLWLRPSTGPDRPWLTIVGQLPKSLQELAGGGDASVDVEPPFPTLQVRGHYLKRLSYRSAQGVELTPVLVGRVVAIRANGNQAVRIPQPISNSATSAGIADRRSLRTRFIAAVLVCCAVGFGLGGWVMSRSKRQVRAARQRRHQRQVTIPSELGSRDLR